MTELADPDELETTPDYRIPLEHLGPVWEENPDWDGVSLLGPHGKYMLPELTLGYQVWSWVRGYPDDEGNTKPMVLSPDSTEDDPQPFQPTYEQYRFVLWWYAVDKRGRWLFRRGVLQRLKGWGKDPIAGVISLVELAGPCRFKGWARNDMPKYGRRADRKLVIRRGDPVGEDNPNAWIQVAAVTKTQTQNTMLLFPSLISPEFKRAGHMRGDSIGVTKVTAFRGRRQIQAVTSNPKALEGGRPSLVIANEALALDTPIPTPNGWTTMGELRTGDVVYGSDGSPTSVVDAFPTQEGRRCFRVTFATGDSIVASDGHWWKVRVANNRNCKLREMTTQQMFDAGREFFLPELQGLETGDDVELPIDPYILGLWLGDGTAHSSQIATDPQDTDEIIAEIVRLGVPGVRRTGNKGQLGLSDTPGQQCPIGYKGRSVQSRLRQMGLLRNKHIPDIYLRASRAQRLALLQGLMDSDGHIRPNGNARFCNTDPRLIEGARDLLLGLGYECNQATWETRGSENWPDRAHWKPLGVISFVAYDEANPFRLTRKAKYARSGPIPLQRLRRIARIEEVDSVPVRCIAVAADDHLFRAGHGMHSTRNTEHWVETNRGWEMDSAIDRNAAKSKGGAARRLSICNAPEPSEESVGLRERNAYLAEMEGSSIKTGVLYDSLEVPEHVDLVPPGIEHLEPEEQEPYIMAWLMAILRACRGDSFWLDPERIALEILDRKVGSTSIARRFYLNQTIASDDASFDPKAIDAAVDVIAALQRSANGADPIRCGWDPVRPDEPIVMFFDGSKSDDATALVGCRISDGYCFTIGVWQPPAQKRRRQIWLAPRGEVDRRVEEAFDRFTVVGFWADPSHAKDDEDGAGYWYALIDEWHRRYNEELTHWATKTGHGAHSILWDMSSPLHTKMIVEATERVTDELERKNSDGDWDPAFLIDGHPRLKEHLKNCRRAPGRDGVGVRKESRESLKKIDAAVCLIGARMLRRVILNSPVEEESHGGWAYSV